MKADDSTCDGKSNILLEVTFIGTNGTRLARSPAKEGVATDVQSGFCSRNTSNPKTKLSPVNFTSRSSLISLLFCKLLHLFSMYIIFL